MQFFSRKKLRCVLLLFLLLCAPLRVLAAEKSAIETPDFYASFNGTLDAVGADGRKIAPLEARGVRFVDGLQGKAAFIGGNGDMDFDKAPTLQYPANGLLDGAQGTLMFWVKPDWDGVFAQGGEPPFYRFLYAGPKFNVFMYYWLRWDLGGAGQTPQEKESNIELINQSRRRWMRGDWWHIALVWNSAGLTKLFVNGLPYGHGLDSGASIARRVLAQGKIESFFVGSQSAQTAPNSMRADAAFADLKIYRRALSDSDVVAQYRRFSPFDLAQERQYLRANTAEKIDLDFWPGGQMTKPLVGNAVAVPVKTSVAASFIHDADGKVIAQQTFPLEIRGEKTLSLPLPPLQTGNYRAVYRWKYGGASFQTSRRAFVYQPQKAAPTSASALKLGAPLVEINCVAQGTNGLESGATQVVENAKTGAYREAASTRDSRFSYEIDLSAAAIDGKLNGAPMQIDIYWPDDKPRSMGLYLYRESQTKEQRDRLEGGVQSGNEYALSHRTQKTSYLIYPWTTKYLFEARTIIEGFPAAVSKIVVRPVIGRLPKLALHLPAKGLQSRSFGHLDEDQSFDALFAYDAPLSQEAREVKNLEMLLDYLDYTGQDSIRYPFIRYGEVQYDLPGAMGGGGSYFQALPDWRSLMLDMFAARGKKVTAIINEGSMVEATKLETQRAALAAQGYFQRDRNGKSSAKGNPLHPLYRKQFFGHLNELLRRFGKHPALAGIDLWNFGDWQIADLNLGYDDLTIKLFTRETGIAVPGGSGEERYNARYTFLTGAKRREWLAWRAQQNTEFLAQIAKTMRAVNAKLVFGVTIGNGTPVYGSVDDASDETLDFAKYFYEEQSLDIKALQKIPGLSVTPMRQATMFRWQQHRTLSYTTSDDLIYNLKKQALFRNAGQSHVASYMTYYESFNDSLDPKNYGGYFQNADIKGYGRFFLKELAADVASADPAAISIGGQPIGTSGRDAETREFARAFRALPVGNFLDVAGMRDPVYVRSFATAQGIYLYAQNVSDGDVTVKIAAENAAASTRATDLSSGNAVTRTGKSWTIHLKSFQLRSFLLPRNSGKLRVVAIEIPRAVLENYQVQAAALAVSIAALRAQGADTSAYDALLKSLQAALRENRIAEAHRLLWSKPVRLLPGELQGASRGFLKTQKEMVARGHIAIKCGSNDFYQSEKGTLFFPDQAFAPGGYGFFGSHDTAVHDIGFIADPTDRGIFFTEAYNLKGYRFTVPRGKYTVRLYHSLGYEPDRAPGKYVMTMDIQGQRVWENKDVFLALGKDASKTFISELKNIDVKNDTLTVEFQPVNGVLGHCNAIEVVPE